MCSFLFSLRIVWAVCIFFAAGRTGKPLVPFQPNPLDLEGDVGAIIARAHVTWGEGGRISFFSFSSSSS